MIEGDFIYVSEVSSKDTYKSCDLIWSLQIKVQIHCIVSLQLIVKVLLEKIFAWFGKENWFEESVVIESFREIDFILEGFFIILNSSSY